VAFLEAVKMEPTAGGVETMEVPKTRWTTKLLVIITLSSNLAFSGLIFGWGPLKLLLSQDGVYRDLCDDKNGAEYYDSGGGYATT
jgi:hypothetical protein